MRLHYPLIILTLAVVGCNSDTSTPKAVANAPEGLVEQGASKAPLPTSNRKNSAEFTNLKWTFSEHKQSDILFTLKDKNDRTTIFRSGPKHNSTDDKTLYESITTDNGAQPKPAFTILGPVNARSVAHNPKQNIVAYLRTDTSPPVLRGIDVDDYAPIWTQKVQLREGKTSARLTQHADIFIVTGRTEASEGPIGYRNFYDARTGDALGTQLLGEPFLSAFRGGATQMLPATSTDGPTWSMNSFRVDSNAELVAHRDYSEGTMTITFTENNTESFETTIQARKLSRVALSGRQILLMNSWDGIIVLDRTSGDVIWDANTTSKKAQPVYELASMDEHYIVFQTRRGVDSKTWDVRAYDAKTGEVVVDWENPTNAPQ